MRKLAAISVAFSAAVFIAHYLLPSAMLLPGAGVFALLFIAALFGRGKRVLYMRFGAAGVALGLLLSFAQVKTTLEPAAALAGEEITVSARVLEFPTAYEDYTVVSVKLLGQDVPNVSARLYDYNGDLPQLRPGDEVLVTASFSNAGLRYGETSDYYSSRSIFAVGYTKGAATLEKTGGGILYFPQYAAQAVISAVEGAFSGDSAAFMKALLMGDKADFYLNGRLYSDMKNTGLIHVVAVSGLHVSFLVGFLQLLLGRNRRSSILCLCIVWLFVVMTGAGPSSVRAGFMQTMYLAAPLFLRRSDDITSLSSALMVILAVNPCAAGSAGLQMSFAAMAGIMFISPAIYARLKAIKSKHLPRRVASYVFGAFSSSIGATVLTAPILALRFGYVPLMGVVANVLCLWAVTLCFCGGFIACALWAVFPAAGAAAASVVALAVKYISAVVGLLAAVPYGVIYLSNAFLGVWLIFVYILFFAAIFRSGGKFRLAVPTVLSLISLCCVIAVTSAIYSSPAGYLCAIDVGQGQCLALMSGQSTVLIDCGGKSKADNAGQTAGAFLLGRGRRRVDALVLTHLHADHANGVSSLMDMLPVDKLILGQDMEDEDELLDDILQKAAENGTEVVYLTEDTSFAVGGIELSIFAPLSEGGVNESCLSMVASVGDIDALITGDMGSTQEKKLVSTHDLSGMELVIAGHHGSKSSSTMELLTECGAKTAIFSVGYNTYGHPSAIVFRRMAAAGVENYYRTDMNGSITISAGEK